MGRFAILLAYNGQPETKMRNPNFRICRLARLDGWTTLAVTV